MNIRVNKLALKLDGVRGVDAKQLSQAIGRDLGALASNLEAGTFDRLRVNVSMVRGASVDDLSRQIVGQILQSIARRG